MLKRSTILLIAAMLILLTTVPGTAYERLTEDEAIGWLQSITTEELVDFIIRYDYVEHAEPEIEVPEYNIFHAGDTLYLNPTGPMMFSVGHLEYEISLPEQQAAWAPPDTCKRGWWFIGGLLAGIASATAVFLVVR